MATPHRNGWLPFEDDDDRAAEYADFDEQVEMSPDDAAEHHEHVTRVAEEYGFKLSKWKPTIPSRFRSRS